MGTGKVDEHKKETSHPLNSVLKGKTHICFDEVAGFIKYFTIEPQDIFKATFRDFLSLNCFKKGRLLSFATSL